jgi:uncharacterized protein (TIGR02996 family)
MQNSQLHPEELALLAAVIANPADDLPRLMYADYLDDLGGELNARRAEFIRLQCELAQQNPRPVYSDRPTAQQIRERLLLQRYSHQWTLPFRRPGLLLFTNRTHEVYRRGFIELVWMPANWLLRKATRLWHFFPIMELRLTRSNRAEFAQIIALPQLQQLHTLDVTGHPFDDATVAIFAQARPLSNLKHLVLRGCNIMDDTALSLSVLPWLQHLEQFDLCYNSVSPEVREVVEARCPGATFEPT